MLHDGTRPYLLRCDYRTLGESHRQESHKTMTWTQNEFGFEWVGDNLKPEPIETEQNETEGISSKT